MSSIEFTENTQTKELKTALDSDNLLMMSYYFFGIIAFLVSIGLGWDLWEYRKRTQPASGSAEGR
jgi:heme/copper-type cytochrome/quinol oxidase subunit 2